MHPILPAPARIRHALISYPLSPRPALTMFHSGTYAAALDALARNAHADLFIAYGTADDFTSVSKFDRWAGEWATAAREQGAAPVRIARIQDATHFWVGEARDELLRVFLSWVDDGL
jgi:uncharacterized protein